MVRDRVRARGWPLTCFEMPWKVLFLAILSAFLIILGSRRPTRAGDCERAMLAESRLVIERSRGTCRVKGGDVGDFGGGSLEHRGQWLGAQWAGPEPPGAP